MAQRIFAGAIWTNHALERLGQRGLTQELAASAFLHPDDTIQAKNGGKEFQKRVGTSLITIIAKKTERNEWLIVSCWIDPPLPGSVDIKNREHQRKLQYASFWGKIWLTVRDQLFSK